MAWAPGKGVKGKDLKDYWEGDLGVSYIPWSKLKPDIDVEMLEDGGMIDEDTMPIWMKAKVAQNNVKPQETAPGSIQLPEVLPAPATVDTSQPPPVPPGSLLQPPPPLTLPLVNPFQINNRLLGSVGMNMPPMMPNVPIGVPPPSLTGPLMPNQLLGLGSPFQGPPGLMQQLPLPTTSTSNDTNKTDTNMPNMQDMGLGMPQPFGIVPQPPSAPNHDDMDVEMEDADHKSEQTSQYNNDRMHNNQRNEREVDRRDRRDDRERNRSRDRERDRDRRDRSRRNSRERNRDRDRDNSRGERRDDRRDRNRWGGDRDRRDRDRNERDDRRDREKALNDRLREMAGMDGPIERDDVPPLLERPPLFPDFNGDQDKRDLDGDRFRRGDFDHRRRDYPPPIMDRPDFDTGRDDFDAPPRPIMHRDNLMDDRFIRRDRFPDDMRMMDDFDRMRGPPPVPDFYPPPRDGFGPPPPPPRPPMMRGPGMDGFPPRPMMGRPPGPHMYHPRGPPMRGPRPGKFKLKEVVRSFF